MCVEPFEDGAMIDIVQHLRLALEICETSRLAKLSGYFLHERSNVSVTALVPVVVRPGIAHRPLVSRRDGVLKRFQGGHRRRAHLDRKAPVKRGEELRWWLVTIRSTVLQIDLVGTRRVVPGAINFSYQLLQSLIDDGWRNTFVAPAPDGYRRMVAKTEDRILGIRQKQRGVCRFKIVVLRRIPKIVPHQQAILVGQIIEDLF